MRRGQANGCDGRVRDVGSVEDDEVGFGDRRSCTKPTSQPRSVSLGRVASATNVSSPVWREAKVVLGLAVGGEVVLVDGSVADRPEDRRRPVATAMARAKCRGVESRISR